MRDSQLTIVVDANMPLAQAYFGELGRVRQMSSQEITARAVSDADILLVRSETKVDASLLEGSEVRFVGTATSGIDHIDTDYLQRRGIAFAYAPGSNANSVAEYVVAALLHLSEKHGIPLAGKSIGVIGVGEVGSRVVRKAEALGLRVLKNDPPKALATGAPDLLPLEHLLDCDIITLHTPLTRSGDHPTDHLFDDTVFQQLKSGCIFMNTSRGSVADTAALKQAITSGRVAHAVIDVWEGEPDIDTGLLELASIATPHIAGYSYDGKTKATQVLFEAACRFLGCDAAYSIEVEHTTAAKQAVFDFVRQPSLHAVVKSCYDIEVDDMRLRKITALRPDARGAYFRGLRQPYPRRREFCNTRIVNISPNSETHATLAALGFQVPC